MPTPLMNPKADRVRRLRALASRKARSEGGQFLVEGPQAVRELLLHRAAGVSELLITPAALARYPEIAGAARTGGVVVREASPDVIAAISPNAQQVLAVANDAALAQPFGPTATADLDLAQLLAPARLVAVFYEIRDPGNAGTVIRAADAAGADLVVFAGECVEIANPKVVRASAGSLFHLPVFAMPDLGAVVVASKAAGLTVLAADVSGQTSFDALPARAAWLFGNEARGLPEDALALADRVVRIPIFGAAESLNLAMAATLCLYGSAVGNRAATI